MSLLLPPIAGRMSLPPLLPITGKSHIRHSECSPLSLPCHAADQPATKEEKKPKEKENKVKEKSRSKSKAKKESRWKRMGPRIDVDRAVDVIYMDFNNVFNKVPQVD
eukprot:g38142.t1